jgi:hypothetical protein
MNYKVIYHCGDEITIKTKTKSGRLSLTDTNFIISGKEIIEIPTKEIKSVELFRLHGLGRMLKIQHTNGNLFVTVVRFCLFNMFAIINFFKTGALNRELNEIIKDKC